MTSFQTPSGPGGFGSSARWALTRHEAFRRPWPPPQCKSRASCVGKLSRVMTDEIQDIQSGLWILHISEDPIYVAEWPHIR